LNKSANKDFPGGSKSRVNRAGNAVRDKAAEIEDYLVIEETEKRVRSRKEAYQRL